MAYNGLIDELIQALEEGGHVELEPGESLGQFRWRSMLGAIRLVKSINKVFNTVLIVKRSRCIEFYSKGGYNYCRDIQALDRNEKEGRQLALSILVAAHLVQVVICVNTKEKK